MPLESRRSYVSTRVRYFVLDGLRVEATCFAGFSDQDRAGVEGRQLGPPPVRAAAHACALHAEPGIRLFSLSKVRAASGRPPFPPRILPCPISNPWGQRS